MRGRENQGRSALGHELKNYRSVHKLTQEQLAALLEVEPRTLRRWESGETLLADVHELRRVADCLGIPHELLGVAPPNTLSLEDLEAGVERVWGLIQQGFIGESRVTAEGLVRHSRAAQIHYRASRVFITPPPMQHRSMYAQRA